MREEFTIKGRTDLSFCVRDAHSELIYIRGLSKCFVYVLKEMSNIYIENVIDTTIYVVKSENIVINN